MKIKVCPENSELIEKALSSSRSKNCTSHIASANTVLSVAEWLQKKLDKFPKRLQVGIQYQFSMNYPKPKSYKYQYQADTFLLKRCPTGIYLVSTCRGEFFAQQKDASKFVFTLVSDENKKEIIQILFDTHFN